MSQERCPVICVTPSHEKGFGDRCILPQGHYMNHECIHDHGTRLVGTMSVDSKLCGCIANTHGDFLLCRCGATLNAETIPILCQGCQRYPMMCQCKGGPAEKAEAYESITQEQPQPHGEGLPAGERLIELIRERTKLGIEKYGESLTTHNGRDSMLDALQESIDLNQYLMQKLMESEDEVDRLSAEQIKPLADFLMQQSDVIGHPGDEGACAMAIRVIGEFIDKD